MCLSVSPVPTVCFTRECRTHARPRLAVLNSCDHQAPVDSGIAIRLAKNTAELRAAAYLRAAAFYKYAADRSEYAARVCCP